MIYAACCHAVLPPRDHALPAMLHGGQAETERMFYSQESGRQSILDDASAQLTVLAPTNAGLAIEQLGDLQEVRLRQSMLLSVYRYTYAPA